MSSKLEKFFAPRSIAVIGASNSAFNLGATICNIIKYLKYPCEIYAVNPQAEDVSGCRGFASIKEIPGDVDLAIIIISSRYVVQTARECGEKGIKHLIIESAGFSEEGDDGDLLQNELDSAAREFGIRYIGPNCLGIFNSQNRFCSFYGVVPGMYDSVFDKPGSVSYIIQSGGIGALVIDSFQSDVGNVNKLVSIGNKADIDEVDIIDYYDTDKNTEVICMYLESISNGRKLFDIALNVRKPILAFKVGRTDAGAKAASSHTAGMASNDLIFEKACKQSGIIRLKSISELVNLPKIFTEMPILKGKNIAVFTNSGAFGGISADLLISEGFNMPDFSPGLMNDLGLNGKLYNQSNPVDLGPAFSTEIYINIFKILAKSDEVDGILIIANVWQDFIINALAEIVKLSNKIGKPSAIYIPNAMKRLIEIRSQYQLPIFESPEEAVRALSVSYEYYSGLTRKNT